jgi:S1-C subfamily serine protease
MKSLSRPYIHLGAALLALVAVAVAPPGAAQTGISHILQELNPLISHSTPGYLGVLVTDVDSDSVQKLRLKDNHGALVTLIDHDAPAGSALHVNDVVLSVNGTNVEGAEHFGRMLHEIPAGHKVTLLVIRDGAEQTLTIQLVDRKAMEQAVWNKMNSGTFPPPPSGMGMLTGAGDITGWHMPLFTSSLNVGALVEPLTAQMADYLDVPSGVMVKQIARHSEAELAGLKPKDVILKVGAETIKTSADWDRALRSNEGKNVQVTVLRDRRQQSLILQVDSKHHRSRVEWTDIVPRPDRPHVA